VDITNNTTHKRRGTLRMMADYGLVELQKNIRGVQPTALATEFLVVLD
jgi:predicted transcriptional regulator